MKSLVEKSSGNKKTKETGEIAAMAKFCPRGYRA